ncbi:MAG TPA: hypothetical protein VHF51_16110 [Solirubrobacteraceae bacterium]|nr:hypothetical protein [Solirubrobacteraceae bacterium]
MKKLARNLISDLVEKRLWPVAVALLAAIAAIPVLVLRGESAVAPVAPQTAVPAPRVERAQVTLDESVPAPRDRGGPLRDPFGGTSERRAGTSAASGASPAPSAASTAPAGAGSTASVAVKPTSGGRSAPEPKVSVPFVTPAAPSSSTEGRSVAPRASRPVTERTVATYEVTLRFGPTEGERRNLRNVARLTALPSATHPAVAYLGVLGDGKTAAFLVSSKASASGNGECKPSAADCRTIELRSGDAEYFRFAESDDRPATWYYLKLLHIDRRAARGAAARAAQTRRSGAGLEVVRAAAASVRAYRYVPALGVLVRARRAQASAAAQGSADLPPLLPAARQPGVAAFRSVKPAETR